MINNALDALFGKPDYSHIAREADLKITVTPAEMSAIFEAYDRGLDQLDEDTRHALDAVIAKLKDEAHPRSEEHTSELQSRFDLVCRLLLEKKKINKTKSDQRCADT